LKNYGIERREREAEEKDNKRTPSLSLLQFSNCPAGRAYFFWLSRHKKSSKKMSAFVAWPLGNSAKNLIQAGRLHRMKSEGHAFL